MHIWCQLHLAGQGSSEGAAKMSAQFENAIEVGEREAGRTTTD